MDFVKEALLQNSHWESGRMGFPRADGSLVEREAYQRAAESVARKFVTVLRGLRRVGKSFLARQLAAHALLRTRAPTEVAWFEFDRAMNAGGDELDALLGFFAGKGAKLIILDELPFVAHWQDVLKRHYDRTDTKFIATGSSAIELDKRTLESLAGRFEVIEVTPFTLGERMRLEGRTPPATPLAQAKASAQTELDAEEYLRAGGLPEATLEKDKAARNEYINHSLLDPLFYKDFPSVFPNANPDLLRKTLELLSATTASTYQTQNIAEALGCSHPTAATQVNMLEKTLLTRTAYNFTPSIAKQKRTSKKIVFTDTGVLCALNPEATLSQLAENAVLYTLGAKHFWRDAEGREVDAILPKRRLAVEVKYQNTVTTGDEKNLRYFLSKKEGWTGLVVTKRQEKKGEMAYTPLWKLLLNTHSTSTK